MTSRTRTIAIAGLVAAAAAVGLFLWQRGGDDDAPGDDAAEQDSPAGGAPKRVTSSSDGTPPAALPIAMDDDPVGPLRLEGQVLGPEDEPIGGAQVTLSSVPPRTTTTEGDGSFAFDKLVGRTYVLTARSGELVSGPVTHTLRDEPQQVIIRLEPGASIEVTVVAAGSGKPISGATVEARGTTVPPETTGGDGRALLRGVARGGMASVAARADGYAPAQALIAVPDAPGAVASAQIELRAGAPVSGVVVSEDGAPIAGAQVSERDVAAPFDLPDPRDQVTTDDQGRFTLPAVAAGTYRVQATHKTHAPGSSEAITVDGATPKTDVRVVLEKGGVLAGKVVDQGGAPVPWATVRVGAVGGWAAGPNQMATRQVVAGDDGAFEIQGLPRKALRALAMSEEASSAAVPVDLSAQAERRDLVLRLDIAGRIEGIVVDGAGEPVPEVRVVALPDFFAGESGEDFPLRGAATEGTDGGGRFVLRGLPEGKYRLHANRGGASQNWWGREGTRAQTGDTEVRVVLEADGRIRGVVALEDGSPAGLFTVSAGWWSPPVPSADPRGAFELPAVPPGSHDLTIRGPEFAEKTVRGVEVKPGEVTDVGTITVTRGRSVTGRVLTAGGKPVAGATVVLGKQLLGDGTSLASSAMKAFEAQTGVRRTQTDGSGYYAIRGIGSDAELVLAAEHEAHGRSAAAVVKPGTDSPSIDLRLLGVGGVYGVVRAGGKPASSVQVFTSAEGAMNQNAMVTTAEDGSYQIDRLAAGSYKVTAMIGAGMGATMASANAQVVAGERARVDIDVQVGTLTLIVNVTPKGEGTIPLMQAILFDGPVSATNGKELQEQMMSAAEGGSSARMAIGAPPARLEKLMPGRKTVCIVPLSADQKEIARGQQHPELLKVYCEPVTVAESPSEQTFDLQVPPMEPIPDPPSGG